ncbi:hypothetical protein [Agaribacterium haliotis]|uniref:hypothetical protein n=1 Tax=Agaribacterium haliotis TaxID=2013869 RepID=UPI000BB57185|nr:hypothetical protein [Agaribacterium haliotis]
MKFTQKAIVGAIAAATMSAAMVPAVNAEVTANAGFVTDYYFRGTALGNSAAYAGADYSAGGFYAGTWWINDGNGANDGLENDWYLGYGGEAGSFSYDVSYVNYQYTYADNWEHELALNLGVAGFSLGLVAGDAEPGVDDVDAVGYNVYTLGYEVSFFSATVGQWENDDDGEYQWAEISFSGDIVEGVSASLTMGAKAEDDVDNDGYMFLDISKSFDLM